MNEFSEIPEPKNSSQEKTMPTEAQMQLVGDVTTEPVNKADKKPLNMAELGYQFPLIPNQNPDVKSNLKSDAVYQMLQKKLIPSPREYRDIYLDFKEHQKIRAKNRNQLQKIGYFLGKIPILEILTILAGLSGMIFLCIFVGRHAGVYSTIIAATFAVLPLLIVMSVMLYLTRWDKEPSWLIAIAFLWGAGVATTASLFGNHGGMNLVSGIDFGPSPLQTEGVTATVVAPIVEETLKGTGVLLILLIRRKYLNSPLNGLVIAGIVAAGFAYSENILYFARSIGVLPVIFIVRGIISPFAHSIFTSFIGMAIALSLTRLINKKAQIGLVLAGFVTAMCLHATWNGLASYNPIYFLFGYFIFWGPLFSIWIIVALVLSGRQRKWVNLGLAQYHQQGWISVAEWKTLAVLDRRRLAVIRAKKNGHKAKREVVLFQKAASSLALNYVTSVHVGLKKPLFKSNIFFLSQLLESRANYLKLTGLSDEGGEVGALAFLDKMITASEKPADLAAVSIVNQTGGTPVGEQGENQVFMVANYMNCATISTEAEKTGTTTGTETAIRKAVRVIIIGDHSNVLLVHGHDFADPRYHWWFTVGGGAKSGENSRQTAIREIYEETGLSITENRLVGPVLHRRGKFEFRTITKIQEEEFYLLYINGMEAVQIHTGNWSQSEQKCLDELRWIPIVDILKLTDSSVIYPQVLPSFIYQYRYSWDGKSLYIDETR